MDYIIKNGTKIEGLSGASDSDVTVTGMVREYIITVVAARMAMIRWRPKQLSLG
ncbi:hypothetical protein NXV78_25765 [Bacteroides cellulosilyticus]|uniref:hypothetical protein n=1 Tax=Bacteroides cellulosilyticus TaxID=246787 RepID=UPI0021659153|nr:hypothetical protein [Bacteroides cellulosilyticus]MCS3057418.1 hypothetical protein [Bacteroides cellulosilyticus]